jgi:2-dehydro-3-deoxygluconokinase
MIKEWRSPSDIRIHYYRRGSAASAMTPDVAQHLASAASRIHVSGITLAIGDDPRTLTEDALKAAQESGTRVSFDPNFRSKIAAVEQQVAWTRRILPYVDDLLLSETEAILLTETETLSAALGELERLAIPRVVVRRGAHGVVGLAAGVRVEQAAIPTDVVDTVGAGDAFTSGYLHGMLQGHSFTMALTIGNWVASNVVRHWGDHEGLPDAVELAIWMSDESVESR